MSLDQSAQKAAFETKPSPNANPVARDRALTPRISVWKPSSAGSRAQGSIAGPLAGLPPAAAERSQRSGWCRRCQASPPRPAIAPQTFSV